tara:strand:+ start:68 stop:673 length:606 start_codon:yes stop_codon:yes gene_type:complete
MIHAVTAAISSPSPPSTTPPPPSDAGYVASWRERVEFLERSIDRSAQDGPGAFHPAAADSPDEVYRGLPLIHFMTDEVPQRAYVRVLGDDRPWGLLYPHNLGDDYVAALWVTNQHNEVVHLAEFRPSTGAAVPLPPGQPIGEFVVPANATQLTAHALTTQHGLFDGVTLELAEEDDEGGGSGAAEDGPRTCPDQGSTCSSK